MRFHLSLLAVLFSVTVKKCTRRKRSGRSRATRALLCQVANTNTESFLEDLRALDTHLAHLSANASAYSPGPLLQRLSALRAPLEQHLHHEVTLLASLATHPSAPARDSFAGAVAGETLMNWGKNSVSGTFDVVPFFLLNVDRTVADDEGRWANWPPMPEPVRWGLVNGAGAVRGGWWRFASCDAKGRPRELHAVRRAAERRRREQEGKAEL